MLTAATLCLALNVFYEARSELEAGQYAVALVTVNRANRDHVSVCRTVFAPSQFSWTSDPDKSHTRAPKGELQAWRTALRVARDTLDGRVPDFTGGSTYYHTRAVHPKWRHAFVRTMVLGAHVFYRAS